jgi:4-aminobutyrate aminotransferase-like enzyme
MRSSLFWAGAMLMALSMAASMYAEEHMTHAASTAAKFGPVPGLPGCWSQGETPEEALANITEMRNRRLVERSTELGTFLLAELRAMAKLHANRSKFWFNARGLGLLAGLELLLLDGSPATKMALATIKSLLHRGFIMLPEGESANVISFTPPLTISKRQLQTAVDALAQALPRPRAR